MKNWYQSAPVKGLLLILEHICVVGMAVCLIVMLTYPGWKHGETISGVHKTEYSDSKGFESHVQRASHEILTGIKGSELTEIIGEYDPDKIVDAAEYVTTGKVSGRDINGLSYRLEDLKKCTEEQYEREAMDVVVCSKGDGTYAYFEIEDFAAKVKSGEFRFWRDHSDEYLNALREGVVHDGYFGAENMEVINKEKEIIYTSFWNFPQDVPKNIKTSDGKTMLELVNENQYWNGRLEEACNYLMQTVSDIDNEIRSYKEMKERWGEGNTNLTYLFADFDNNKLYSNRERYSKIQSVPDYIEELKKNGKYVIATPKLADFETNTDAKAADWCKTSLVGTRNYIYMISVDTEYPIQDQFYMEKESFDVYAPYMNKVIACGIISIVGFVVGLVWLTIAAGRRVGHAGITLVWFDRIKTELAAALVIGAWVFIIVIIGSGIDAYAGSAPSILYVDDMIVAGVIAAVSCACFFTGYLSLVRRIKAKTLWKNSVTLWLINVIKKFIQYRSYTWKITLASAVFLFVHWIAIGTGSAFCVAVALTAEGLTFYFVIREVIARKKIQKGIEEIAGGNVEYQISLDGLKGDNLDMAGQINNIGEGLNKAVEQSMKSERLKTDLITNVSHDIKTPLTSIINYVDLLKRENIEDPKIQGYLDILEAKSQRLKTLTEDVVEASKISSGNISMEYRNIDFVEMVHQTTGEFEEKFSKRNLKIVLNVPDHPVMIRSDGRRMWRVIENIYNNAAKYSQEGTRVYADLIEKEKMIEFSLKNISEQPLNISAEELTERFIRGDVSRSTEGSGLGLSIAENLTKMQGGEFKLYLDGDLFKVTICFPKI